METQREMEETEKQQMKADKHLSPPLMEEITINYDVLLHKNLSIQQTVDLPGWAGKMLVFNGELLCLIYDIIDVYNPATGQHKRTLSTGFNQACSMAITRSGQLLVTSWAEGLSQCDLVGRPIKYISREPHWDVTALCDGGGAVVLRGNDGVIYLHQYNSEIQKIHRTNTPIRESIYDCFTCEVACGFLYICSNGQNCIYQTEIQTGNIIRTYGRNGKMLPGHLNQPFLCCSDGKMLLIADYGNNRLQLFDCESNEWKVLDITGLYKPIAAVVDSHGRLFVAGEDPYMLYSIY